MHQKKNTTATTNNVLSDLGEKIFLDRYALKDMEKQTLAVGDLVIVCVDHQSGQRELGNIIGIEDQHATIELRDGEKMVLPLEHVDKPLETRPEETMARVARGIAEVEEGEELQKTWEENYRWLLDGFKFIPGGRILTAAGSEQKLSYYNCYVIPSPHDSRQGIVDTLSEMVEIMSRGGGVGITLSSLRPRHAYVKGVNGRSSGSVSWGGLYSFVTGLIEQGGSRRGALMLILDVWHPDVLEFINAKREMGKITNANISVGIPDEFMDAVRNDEDWNMVFPDSNDPAYETKWDGNMAAWTKAGRPVIVHKTVKAREIWNQIVESAWASAEPGLWFNGRANKMSNSHYFAPLISCNPCAEEPLPGYGVCNLGSLNLPRFLTTDDNGETVVDWDTLGQSVHYAVRFLDAVIDANPYFFENNRTQQLAERRVGLGSMGVGEMMIRLKLRYGSPESLKFLDKLYKFIACESYRASAELAEEKGQFPLFKAEPFLESGFMKGMPEDVREVVREKGVRNVTLLTQPPTGTTGTMVGTSTGIEPFFYWQYDRRSRLGTHTERVNVYQEWLDENDGTDLPEYFVTAMDLSPEEHVRVLATIQRWVDAAISKTSNLPADYTVDQTRELYELMYELGCKGGTIYRDRSRDEQVLNLKDEDIAEEAEVVEETVVEMAAAPAPAPAPLQPAPAAWGQPGGVRPRPYKRYGVTFSKQTPAGTAHITMNDDEEGNPIEVFVEIGKAGSDIKAMAEALGRMMSLVLRLNSHLPPRERIERIISQIKGIGGAQSLGMGPNRVLSLPDAVGQALEEHYFGSQEMHPLKYASYSEQAAPAIDSSPALEASTSNGVKAVTNGAQMSQLQEALRVERGSFADLCPSCGQVTYLRSGACYHCISCGYSRC